MSAEQRDQSMKYASVQFELVVCKISSPFPHNNLQPWAKAGVCIRLNWWEAPAGQHNEPWYDEQEMGEGGRVGEDDDDDGDWYGEHWQKEHEHEDDDHHDHDEDDDDPD